MLHIMQTGIAQIWYISCLPPVHRSELRNNNTFERHQQREPMEQTGSHKTGIELSASK